MSAFYHVECWCVFSRFTSSFPLQMGLVGVWLALGLDEIVRFYLYETQVAEKYAENVFS